MNFRLNASAMPLGYRHVLARALVLAGLVVGAALAGCASTDSSAGAAASSGAQAQTAAPVIAVPPTSVGTWYDLGHFLAPWMAGDAPVPVTGPAAPTRVAGLRREDGHWLAIILVQTAPAGAAPCPAPTELRVVETGRSDGCLRMRGDVDFDRWLQLQHSVLYHWLDGRGWTSRPRAWTSYRVPDAGGRMIEAHALVNPVLLEPTTRNNLDFLSGGQSAVRWAQGFAAATRAAAGGTLDVPPFPFAPRVAPAPEPVVVAPAAAASKPVALPPVQTRPPVQAPRSDRQ